MVYYISKAFDTVWNIGLLYKFRNALPSFYKILESYMYVKKIVQGKHRELNRNSGDPQESIGFWQLNYQHQVQNVCNDYVIQNY